MNNRKTNAFHPGTHEYKRNLPNMTASEFGWASCYYEMMQPVEGNFVADVSIRPARI
jgi:hypothetical protein